jgi:D-glycero-alpha-D-manno-heptose-7-phosphate kinase
MLTVRSRAPIRVGDCGGWTDTWFAAHGRVFNIAVGPRVEVDLVAFPGTPAAPRVVLNVRDFGDRYAPALVPGVWERHPLLEASIQHVGVPDSLCVEIGLSCEAPPGASTGTSAAVTVALVGALMALRDGRADQRAAAREAQAVETRRLGQQCGIQDQICSAVGGLNDIEMTAYPEAVVRPIVLEPFVRAELQERLTLVFLGRGHSSSDIHRRVIARLEGLGHRCPELETLRRCAAHAVEAARAGDLDALGQAMIANNEAQRALHPDLVCRDAQRVIALAREHGAAGWKVNGAGGDGGSLTIVGARDGAARRAFADAIQRLDRRFRLIPIELDAEGLTVSMDGASNDDRRGADEQDAN